MLRNKIPVFIVLLIGLWSCGNDDNGSEEPDTSDPPRPLSEVALEDDEKIQNYLESHFYNYEEFDNPSPDFDFVIRIGEIDASNPDKTPLSEQVEFVDLSVSSTAFFGLEEENDVKHRLYYLIANKDQTGDNPTIADSVFLKYTGFRLDDFVFDTNLTWFDLPGTPDSRGQISGGIRGFTEGLTFFKDGDGIMENDNGTFKKLNSGVGLVIMPSGLGYFNGTQVGESFAPLIFEINLLETNRADHDRDGIPSSLENLNGNETLLDDDTDENGLPNYLDPDDDNDGISTRDEIEIDAEGNITYPDCDSDGTPDYLDADSCS